MNKIILAVLLMVSTGAFATFESGKCADGSGDLITTNQNIQYCQSKIGMNWFSAHAWCESIGKPLIDITKDCVIGDITGSTIQCPHLYDVGSSDFVWTQNVYNNHRAYYVYTSTGAIGYTYGNGKGDAFKVLCRITPY